MGVLASSSAFKSLTVWLSPASSVNVEIESAAVNEVDKVQEAVEITGEHTIPGDLSCFTDSEPLVIDVNVPGAKAHRLGVLLVSHVVAVFGLCLEGEGAALVDNTCGVALRPDNGAVTRRRLRHPR